jgi:leader peptidase (prepilin peptidase) / N-methyltransferase
MQDLIAFVVGSMVGSFLNVCILRMPKDESIVFPASHCTSCQKPIAWFDNIPIVSFLALGARCRHCKKKISWQYPVIEAVTGVLFVVFLREFGPGPKGALYLYLSMALLVQSVIDARHRIIPDLITLPAIVVALAASAIFPEIHGKTTHLDSFLASLKGVLLGGGFLYAVGTVAEWILKKEAMGGGDVKLLAAIGGVIGWRGVVWTIFVSALIGSVVGIYSKIRKGEELIPYGPFLAMAAFLYLFVGPQVIEWYMGLLGMV